MNAAHPQVLIFTIANRPVTIANFGFMPRRAFSVYGQYEEFLREVAQVQQSDENFINWLIHQGYGDYITPELIPENVSKFLTWEVRPTAMDFATTFDIVCRHPTVMTQHLLEQLASGYRTPVFQEHDFSRDDYFQFMKEKAIDPESIDKLRMTVAISVIKAKENKLIKEHGYTKQFVTAGADTPPFCYSIGLTAQTGFEVLCVAALPMEHLACMVDYVAKSYLPGGEPFLPGIYEGWLIGKGEIPLRTQLKEVVLEQARKEYVMNTRGEVTRVFQVLIADKNNVLPGEPGYDIEFLQPNLDAVQPK